MGAIKFASLFFLGNLAFGSLSILIAIVIKDNQDPIVTSIVISASALIAFIVYIKRKKLFSFNLSSMEAFLILLLFVFGFYIMQKSFSYSIGTFEIASNQYFDFGVHLPVIRSFSFGDNIPPEFPFYSNNPMTYHFLFDYLTALYEKIGIRIDYAFNILSSFAFAGVCIFIYSIGYELFDKNRTVGILSVILFLFNSSLSFVEAIKKYGINFNSLGNVYHHNIYLGNGPFGESIVSIFWDLNTYLNQRQFLFGLGSGLLIVFFLLITKKFSKKNLIMLGIVIGVLPLWHITVFISLITILSMFVLISESNRENYLAILAISIIVSLPSLLYISINSDNQIVFRPGFLAYEDLNLASFGKYWFFNLGLSLLTIIFGLFFSNKKQKLFFSSVAPLFILPNFFQFGAQMFDNHKFFNIFIIFANMYSAYLIHLFLKRKIVFKILGLVLIFILILSGIVDFFVIKNDVKAKIPDFPSNKFQTWVLENTDKDSVFLSNKEIYDPVTLVGRKSYLGFSHYLFPFGKNPDERIKGRSILFSSDNMDVVRKLLAEGNITYILLYKDKNVPANQKLYEEHFKKAYEDQEVTLLKN